MSQLNPHLPWQAEITKLAFDSPHIFSFWLRLTDPDAAQHYSFQPGQFNMLYLHGVGEVAISVVSDPESPDLIRHTIRVVGRVTEALSKLTVGDQLGLRGPYGRGWPMEQAKGKDVVVVTGGLGCAPVVSAIHQLLANRADYGRLFIVQGVRHTDDLIWREQYQQWMEQPDTEVRLAADGGEAIWPHHQGSVMPLLDDLSFRPEQSVALLCGPEGMMRAAAEHLCKLSMPDSSIFLSMERNMQCALGLCGHCQYGADFICREGPVFCYPDIAQRLTQRGV